MYIGKDETNDGVIYQYKATGIQLIFNITIRTGSSKGVRIHKYYCDQWVKAPQKTPKNEIKKVSLVTLEIEVPCQ